MLDFAFIYQHLGLFQSGLILTLQISICGIMLAMIIGLICACVLVEYERISALKKESSFIYSINRATSYTSINPNALNPYTSKASFTFLCYVRCALFALCDKLSYILLMLRAFIMHALALCITCYVELARNTPLLIQLFFLYFALPKIGITLEAFTCATIGLAFLGGGYMCESFRAGLSSISKAQVESALSIGLSPLGVLRFVVLPQGFYVALPSLTANVIFLIKETSVVGILALGDILYISKDIIDFYGKTYEALVMLLLVYMAVLLPISLGASYIESKLHKHY